MWSFTTLRMSRSGRQTHAVTDAEHSSIFLRGPANTREVTTPWAHFQGMTAMRVTTVMLILSCCLASAVSCDGTLKSSNTSSDASGDGLCLWPANLDNPDAGDSGCYAVRSYPSCQTLGGSDSQCENACTSQEYAVICGGPGPAQPPPLPAGCRAISSGPGGNNVGCCECGS